ncbi:MAG: hypothetical protein EBS64_01970 [Verrucomicrobia bacterium]|nr:hypothetical protein [Verrucomicrobiota bacterium]NBY37344.1 hypothetical protein [Verrucomicrobiota bacterium]
MSTFFKPFLIVALAALPGLASAALQNGKVEVSQVSGQVTMIDATSHRKALTTGTVFQQGTQIITAADSSAELQLSNGSTILISPDSHLELRTFRQVPSRDIVGSDYQKVSKEPSPSVTEVMLLKGKIVGEVRKLNPSSTYTVKTPVGLVAIRGTVYTVECGKSNTGLDKIEVECVRGAVEATIYEYGMGPVAIAPSRRLTANVTAVKDPILNPPNLVATKLPELGRNISAVEVYMAEMSSVQLRDLSANLVKSSSLPPEVSDGIEEIAKKAPGRPDAPAEIKKDVPPVPPSISHIPQSNTPSSGSTGPVLQQILDNVQKLVEKNEQPNPSPTAG